MSNILYAQNYKVNEKLCIKSIIDNEILTLYAGGCNGDVKLIDRIEYPSKISKINFIFGQEISMKNYIFVSVAYPEDYRDEKNRLNYKGDYNLINVYECNKSCKISNLFSNYFGSGADIADLNSGRIIYSFPFKTEKSIKNEINSKLFNQWISGKINSGIVWKKTNINDFNNFSLDRIGYLVKGDRFKVTDISANWIKVIYTNKSGSTTEGWINCNDTNLCK